MVWARGAGGPSRSGKCGAVPSVPRAHPRRARSPGRRPCRAPGARGRPRIPCRMHLALLGGGRMGEALAVGPGRRAAGSPSRSPSPRSTPTAGTSSRSCSRASGSSPSRGVGGGRRRGLVVAVKPGDVVDALEAAPTSLPEGALVLSIAAGVTIAALEAAAPGRPVVRAMPNTGALVGRGAAAIAAGTARHRARPRAGRADPGRASGSSCGSPRRSSTRSPASRAPDPRTCSCSPRR